MAVTVINTNRVYNAFILIVDSDPSTSTGVVAGIGSIAFDLVGNLYKKTGAANTAWTIESTPSKSNFTTKTANYTITSSDTLIFVDTSGGAFTLTLPSPATVSANNSTKVFRIVDTKGTLSTNNLTLAPFSSEKIEGLAASKVFQTDWGGWQVMTNGTDWFVV